MAAMTVDEVLEKYLPLEEWTTHEEGERVLAAVIVDLQRRIAESDTPIERVRSEAVRLSVSAAESCDVGDPYETRVVFLGDILAAMSATPTPEQ